MSPITVGLIAFVCLFILITLGTPVGLAMMVIGFSGLLVFLSVPAALSMLTFIPYETIASYSLSVMPLFLFMANVAFVSGITRDLYNLASKWLGHQRGGIAMATVGASAGFAAVSASSIATAATMGLIAIPEMKRLKYDPGLATGSVAAGGTIGILIPPSGLLIIYGILTEQSIGQLFVAGVVPGILEAVFYMFTIYLLCLRKPSLGPRGLKTSFKEKIMAFGGCGEMVALVLLVLGGLIIGWFTPTEAGGVGAFGAIVFSLLRGRMNWQKFKQALVETMLTTGMIYFILIGAFIFNNFLALTTIPAQLANYIGGMQLPPLVIMSLMIGLYIFLGCIMDAFAMILLTIPIFFPLATSLGFHPIWFGIIIVRVVEMGMITPPIGINVYTIAGVAPDVPMQTIFKGILPFFVADIFHVALLLFVPSVILYLPSLMY
ncbi:TRAP transporter large permease [Thermodesulfobacteriota bacterium]